MYAGFVCSMQRNGYCGYDFRLNHSPVSQSFSTNIYRHVKVAFVLEDGLRSSLIKTTHSPTEALQIQPRNSPLATREQTLCDIFLSVSSYRALQLLERHSHRHFYWKGTALVTDI